MIIVVSGGNKGGGLSDTDAVLHVTVPTGSTVTATRSGTTLTPTMWVSGDDATKDIAIFVISSSLFSATAWTVTATLNGDSASDTVTIDAAKAYELELSYNLYIFKSGTGEVLPITTGIETSGKGTISISSSEITVGYTTTGNGQVVCFNTTALDVSAYSAFHVVATITDNYTSDDKYRSAAFIASSTPTANGTNNDSKYIAKAIITKDGTEHDTTIDLTSLSSSVLTAVYAGYRGIGIGTISAMYFSK